MNKHQMTALISWISIVILARNSEKSSTIIFTIKKESVAFEALHTFFKWPLKHYLISGFNFFERTVIINFWIRMIEFGQNWFLTIKIVRSKLARRYNEVQKNSNCGSTNQLICLEEYLIRTTSKSKTLLWICIEQTLVEQWPSSTDNHIKISQYT